MLSWIFLIDTISRGYQNICRPIVLGSLLHKFSADPAVSKPHVSFTIADLICQAQQWHPVENG